MMTRDAVAEWESAREAQLTDRYVWGWIGLTEYRRGLVEMYDLADAMDAAVQKP